MKLHLGYRLLLLTGILLLPVSCREEQIVPESKPSTPPSFLEMVQAYRDGKTYTETRTLTTFSKVFFQDGSSVVVPTAEWVIEDGTDTLSYVPKTVIRQGTNWFIDGEDTGIERTNGPLEESVPLYAYRNLKYLRIWASNGETMEFDNGWEPEKPEDPVDPPTPPVLRPGLELPVTIEADLVPVRLFQAVRQPLGRGEAAREPDAGPEEGGVESDEDTQEGPFHFARIFNAKIRALPLFLL